MPFETVDDVSAFFEIDGGPAIRALIIDLRSDPPPYAHTLAVIFDDGTKPVGIYGDTEIEAPEPSFACPKPELDGVKKGMTVRFLGLLTGEEGYGKTYQVERIAGAGAGTSRVFLKTL